jgi:tetratricopeptide (TPR) repeat protein
VARIESITNSVQIIQVSSKAPVLATREGQICAGDTIQVGDNSRALVLMLGSNTPLVIDQNSAFVVTDAPTGGRTVIDLVRGALLFITRIRRSIEIRTPFVNAAIEGTEFVVRVLDDRTVITVFEGIVRATNAAGTVDVGPGQQAAALRGQAPQIQVVVRPRDAVQWALYYDQVLPAASFAELAAIPEANRDASFYVRRASLLLGAGQLEEARADLDQAQTLAPGNGDVDALRTIVAVALNDRSGALTSGRTAVERAPRSAAAQLALSYALQANTQLGEARDAAARATELAPDDGAAWARLAELHLMLDDVGKAVIAARRAAMLSPQVARAQSALGFALLTQLKIADARAAFERAVAAEPDEPVSRLGLGLARIRQGQLAEGRADIELAMALSPNSSLIRSYLGKAYFDEDRERLAEEQLDIASTLDAKDPTPLVYSAILKQALNRPGEALQDLQRSAELNGNRAVYRSRLGIDEDIAVQGARRGRVYRDLGFEKLALLEGWTSVARDPGNHSAHRLLADNYLALPRHQIARDSELLQAQLLQPINVNPVQPRLADNGLSFLDDTGVANVGFNEFTRLFASNQFRVVADGIGGSQATAADNVIVSGIHNRLSYSAGQFHFQTDGIRDNNDAKQDILNGFVQAALSNATSLQAEVRTTTLTLGDRRMLFDPTNFLTQLRTGFDTTSIRVGGRHVFTPGAVLIGSFIHRTGDGELDTGIGLRVVTDDDTDVAEVRYLQESKFLNVTVGGGRYLTNRLQSRTFGTFHLPATETTISHANGYLYADLKLPMQLTVATGVSFDHFDDEVMIRTPFNPKFGFTWPLNSKTTVRGAVFRTFKRDVLSQTIEPTQMAGFNQFFDDSDASQAWRQGLAIDRRLSEDLHAGVEVSHRSLSAPQISVADGSITTTEEDEWSGRAFSYALLTDWLTLGAEYQHERFAGDPEGNNITLLARSTTNRLALESRAFSRFGVFGRARVNFVDQEARYQDAFQAVVSGSDRFWTLDSSIGYRLPHQRGVIAVELRNALDTAFSFQDLTPEEPTLSPKRLVTLRVTLAF